MTRSSSLTALSFWKPLKDPIVRCPLTFCDFHSTAREEFVACDTVTPAYAGESIFLKYSSEHRWYWMRDQQVDEAFLFLSFDSCARSDGVPCESPPSPCNYNVNVGEIELTRYADSLFSFLL